MNSIIYFSRAASDTKYNKDSNQQIMKEVLNFLKDLSRNNNREWFQENKSRYEESHSKILVLTEVLNTELHKIDKTIPLMNPKDCLFRIFRDVRFSNDKSPYKTHFGIYITPGGRKSVKAGYYFHIEPNSSIIAGGLWCPEANILKAVRTEIHDSADEFKEIINNPDFKKDFTHLEGEKLKTAPKGFEKDFPDINLLQYKSYTVSTSLSENQLLSADVIHQMIKVSSQLIKLNSFLNSAIDKWS